MRFTILVHCEACPWFMDEEEKVDNKKSQSLQLPKYNFWIKNYVEK